MSKNGHETGNKGRYIWGNWRGWIKARMMGTEPIGWGRGNIEMGTTTIYGKWGIRIRVFFYIAKFMGII